MVVDKYEARPSACLYDHGRLRDALRGNFLLSAFLRLCSYALGMDSHPLKILLQLHLATDSNSVLHLPYVLATLSAEALQPSVHTQKWTTRIHSLLHSKDASARWAGLCIALQTSVYSRPLMMECAQNWIVMALPALSVRTPFSV